jgi:hypothetical protein
VKADPTARVRIRSRQSCCESMRKSIAKSSFGANIERRFCVLQRILGFTKMRCRKNGSVQEPVGGTDLMGTDKRTNYHPS